MALWPVYIVLKCYAPIEEQWLEYVVQPFSKRMKQENINVSRVTLIYEQIKRTASRLTTKPTSNFRHHQLYHPVRYNMLLI